MFNVHSSFCCNQAFRALFWFNKKSMNLFSIHKDVERYRVNSQWIRDAMSHGDNLIIVAYTYKNNISQWLRYQKPITKVLISSVRFDSVRFGLVWFGLIWLFIQCALLWKWIIAYFALIESSFSLLLLRLIDKDLWIFSTFIHRQGSLWKCFAFQNFQQQKMSLNHWIAFTVGGSKWKCFVWL